MRGDDAADLQRRLGALGFDAGRADGIFGPETDRALRSFQRNAGLLVDGISGSKTVLSLNRLRSKGPDLDAAAVRESVRWASGRPNLAGTRVALGEYGGVGGLLREIQLALHAEGAIVTLLSHPDASILAGQANATHSDLFVGVTLAPTGRGCGASYWGAHGMVSPAGRRLAGLILDELSISGAGTDGPPTPMATAILRETRMPAVVVQLGPPRFAVERAVVAAAAVARGVARWVDRPCLDIE
ncbi:MAG: peptidoglycan-binding protein [Acidimicrobiales bacterium]|nr:peptidoglycan-binding protein [Acidimicrobiales bacterium]